MGKIITEAVAGIRITAATHTMVAMKYNVKPERTAPQQEHELTAVMICVIDLKPETRVQPIVPLKGTALLCSMKEVIPSPRNAGVLKLINPV